MHPSIGFIRLAILLRRYDAGTLSPDERRDLVIEVARSRGLLFELPPVLPGSVLVRCGIGLTGCAGFVSPSVAQLDHIEPQSAGGTTTLRNLQPACEHCNQVKGASRPYAGLAALAQALKFPDPLSLPVDALRLPRHPLRPPPGLSDLL